MQPSAPMLVSTIRRAVTAAILRDRLDGKNRIQQRPFPPSELCGDRHAKNSHRLQALKILVGILMVLVPARSFFGKLRAADFIQLPYQFQPALMKA